jgi:hypothetical protein
MLVRPNNTTTTPAIFCHLTVHSRITDRTQNATGGHLNLLANAFQASEPPE